MSAYDMGRRAYRDGLDMADCPFTAPSEAHRGRSWRAGWFAESCVVGPKTKSA